MSVFHKFVQSQWPSKKKKTIAMYIQYKINIGTYISLHLCTKFIKKFITKLFRRQLPYFFRVCGSNRWPISSSHPLSTYIHIISSFDYSSSFFCLNAYFKFQFSTNSSNCFFLNQHRNQKSSSNHNFPAAAFYRRRFIQPTAAGLGIRVHILHTYFIHKL